MVFQDFVFVAEPHGSTTPRPRSGPEGGELWQEAQRMIPVAAKMAVKAVFMVAVCSEGCERGASVAVRLAADDGVTHFEAEALRDLLRVEVGNDLSVFDARYLECGDGLAVADD